jgi:SAM-dependent methyltransferase
MKALALTLMKQMTQHTGASYDGIAGKYAETVDTKPWNAYYERPALISLLPSLENARVLDAGCGSGWYAEYLLSHGAAVTAVDLNSEFVALTLVRVGDRARVQQADLSCPFGFAEDGEFDVILSALVLHYLRDWHPVLCEFRRVLKPHGTLVFSTHHPFMDWNLFNKDDYFAIELLEDDWKIGKVSFYRRPLTVISQDLDRAGFCIERILEPQPTEDFRREDPEGYERLTRNPWFLCVRARRKD